MTYQTDHAGSFIDKAINVMANSNSHKPEVIVAECLLNYEGQAETYPDKIGSLFKRFQTQTQNAKALERETGVLEGMPPVKQTQVFWFAQKLMNQIIWLANEQWQALKKAEENERENGIDFTQDVADEMGVYVSAENISRIVEDDYEALRDVIEGEGGIAPVVAEYLKDNMPPPFSYYVDNQPNPDDPTGPWIVAGIADNFHDANDIVEYRRTNGGSSVTQQQMLARFAA